MIVVSANEKPPLLGHSTKALPEVLADDPESIAVWSTIKSVLQDAETIRTVVPGYEGWRIIYKRRGVDTTSKGDMYVYAPEGKNQQAVVDISAGRDDESSMRSLGQVVEVLLMRHEARVAGKPTFVPPPVGEILEVEVNDDLVAIAGEAEWRRCHVRRVLADGRFCVCVHKPDRDGQVDVPDDTFYEWYTRQSEDKEWQRLEGAPRHPRYAKQPKTSHALRLEYKPATASITSAAPTTSPGPTLGPSGGSKKAKVEKAAKPEKASKAAKPEKASKADKAATAAKAARAGMPEKPAVAKRSYPSDHAKSSTFAIGMRVRLLEGGSRGCSGTIVDASYGHIYVTVDGASGGRVHVRASMLEPIGGGASSTAGGSKRAPAAKSASGAPTSAPPAKKQKVHSISAPAPVRVGATSAPTSGGGAPSAGGGGTFHKLMINASAVGMDAVREMLESFRLEQYAQAFDDAGYDDLQFLLEMSEDETRSLVGDVGMKPGHAHKFRDLHRRAQAERRAAA